MSKNWLLKKAFERKKTKTSFIDRLLFLILAAGLILIIVFFVYLLWFTLTNRSVTHILPAQKTVAYFELEDLSLPPRLSQDTVFDLVGLTAVLKKVFDLDMKELQDHLSRGRLGLALVRVENEENELLLFFRIRSSKQALEFFEGLALNKEKLVTVGEKENTIYAYPQSQNFVFSFIGPYLFIAKQPEALQAIQAVYRGDEMSLNADDAYQKSVANLPRQTWGHGYLNIQSLSFNVENSLDQIIKSVQPIVNHFVLSIRKEYNGFHFNSLISLNPDLLVLKKGYTDPTRFAYSLADYINSKNLAAYIGGANLGDEWQSTLETISQLNPAYGIILEGLVRAQVNKIFGDDVSLRDDLYPLFEGEYALTFETLPASGETDSDNKDERTGIKLLLKHNDRAFAETKLKKFLDGFQILAAQFVPKLKVFPLPDGTEARELVADSTRIKEVEETYDNYEIYCLDIKDSIYGFCYSVTEDLIIIGNHLPSIKETIDLTTSPRFVLSQSQTFRQTLSNLSAVSDEITFINLDNANALLKNTKVGLVTKDLLSSFEAVTWIKHYFNDGVSTEGYLLLK